MRYALIDESSTVVNVLEWDGLVEYTIPAGFDIIPWSAPAAIGSLWNGAAFSAPPPLPPGPAPTVTGRQIIGQVRAEGASLTLLAAITKAKPDDQLYWNSIALDTSVPTDNPKLSRVLAASGVTDIVAFLQAATNLAA